MKTPPKQPAAPKKAIASSANKATRIVIDGQEEIQKNCFIRKLTEIMNDFSLNQKQIGQIGGVSQAAVSAYLLGNNLPHIRFLLSLAQYTGKNIGWFFDLDTDFDYRAVRRRFSQVLIRLELGPSDMAAALKVTPDRIQAILDGSPPLTAELSALKKLFGLDPWWLLAGHGAMFPDQPPAPSGAPNITAVAEQSARQENPLPPDAERVMAKLRNKIITDPRFLAWLDYEIDRSAM